MSYVIVTVKGGVVQGIDIHDLPINTNFFVLDLDNLPEDNPEGVTPNRSANSYPDVEMAKIAASYGYTFDTKQADIVTMSISELQHYAHDCLPTGPLWQPKLKSYVRDGGTPAEQWGWRDTQSQSRSRPTFATEREALLAGIKHAMGD